MSRIAKTPIDLPKQVEVKVDNGLVFVKGPKGTLQQHLNHLVNVIQTEGEKSVIEVKPKKENPDAWAQAGTARSILQNMIVGVTTGFTSTLELVGVGFRAQVDKNKITLSLGFSHNIIYEFSDVIQIETPNNTTIVVKSIDKQLMGQVVAEIRALRPPEPYKGKGVRRKGEVIVRKEAKKK